MKIHQCEQGTMEWILLRMGWITCSEFKTAMTPPRSKADKEAGAMGETAKSYLNRLVAEALLLEAWKDDPDGADYWGQFEFSTRATRHGNEFEPRAREVYEDRTGQAVDLVGFLEMDGYLIGGSPDGLVGENRIVEFKCLNSENHVKILRAKEVPKDKVTQVQGYLWLSDREVCDFVSYDPRMPLRKCIEIIPVERDTEFIEKLETAVLNFHDHYSEAYREVS